VTVHNDVRTDLDLRSIERSMSDLAGAADQIAEHLEAIAGVGSELEQLRYRLDSIISGESAINVRSHVPTCIGAPLGLNLTPSQCDEIGVFLAAAIRSGALKLTVPLAAEARPEAQEVTA